MAHSELHNHTDYSNLRLLDSISLVSELIDKARELKLKGLAITDHESLSSFVSAEKYLAKKKADNPEDKYWQRMKFIRGNEIYLTRNGLTAENYVRGEDRFFHFILLAKDYKGYLQLCELSSRATKNSFQYYQQRVPTYYSDLVEIVSKNPGHLIGSTACLGGALSHALIQGRDKKKSLEEVQTFCQAWLTRMSEIFGEGNFYLELQPGRSEEQLYANSKIYELSQEMNLPCIITTDSHLLDADDRAVHKAYLQSQVREREVDSFYDAAYMMTDEEIIERISLSAVPELNEKIVREMLDNTNKIADTCEEYSLIKPLEIPYLPTTFDSPILSLEEMKEVREAIPNLDLFAKDSQVCNQQFASRIYHFMIKSDDGSETARYLDKVKAERMNLELGITWEAGKAIGVEWSKYLLQVSDYIEIFWAEGDTILAPSRGSAGASYACHALGINQIDPTREKAPLVFQRFINPERASVLDIDSDVQSNRRDQCIQALENKYGKERVTRVATFKTEKARSAILTAARTLGIDVDIARYIASLCKGKRGIPYTLGQLYYGDAEEDLAPNKEFHRLMGEYPKLWTIAKRIEGLINGLSCHAGGVIITEEPITQHCGTLMTKSGEAVTSYDLHELEDLSLIKIDLLATEGLSKIRTCLDLLTEYGYLSREGTLKERYERAIGVYNLNRDDKDMWKKVGNNEVISLFQMEQQSGVQGIALTKPQTVEDLATLNSVIRLMPPDKESERPLEKFARYKENPYDWEYDMDEYGLTAEEKTLMHEMFDYSNGIAAQQEDLYQLMTSEAIVGYGFGRADMLRKAVAKKNPKDYKDFEDQFWKDVESRGSSLQLCKYIWNVLVAPQKGYSFNLSHCLSYSFVALQEMNLAHFYPIIFWNTANLIVDSGADFTLSEEEEGFVILDDDEDDEEGEKKNTTSRYGKIARAIGRMQKRGISILPPDINYSNITFTPDAEKNTIRYGLKGITKVGNSIVDEIIKNRPYSSFQDLLARVKLNKTQIVSLIKSGAFGSFGNREEIMNLYLDSIAETKKTLNLRNAQMLIGEELIPKEDYDFNIKVFHFNKYLRKKYDKSGYLTLDDTSMSFYQKHFDMDKIRLTEDGLSQIPEPYWKKIYDSYMLPIKGYITKNQKNLLEAVNGRTVAELRDKYAKGSLSRWSMDAVSFYQDEHELENIDLSDYGVTDFWNLPEEPIVKNRFKTKAGHIVEMYQLSRIAGTVIDKDATKSQVTLLTTNGVVTVQAYGVMSAYDKQVSRVKSNGKKTVLEKSWFTRGTLLIVNGMRRGESTFVAKKYSKDPGHHFMKITEIHEDGTYEVQEERIEVE